MRAELIGHFQPCMTDMYLHIDARMADYIRTHPYRRNAATTGCPLHICHITPMICHLEAAGPGESHLLPAPHTNSLAS